MEENSSEIILDLNQRLRGRCHLKKTFTDGRTTDEVCSQLPTLSLWLR